MSNICKPNISETVVRNGYAFLSAWRPNVAAEILAESCGRQLRFGRAEAVHPITPKASSGLNHYSGIFGLGAFPFHTDMAHWRGPPRYMMLRCVKGYGGVSTDLLDSLKLLESVDGSQLSRALVKPRRSISGSLPLMSLFRPQSAGHAAMFRWDEMFLVPASPAGEAGISLVKSTLAHMTKLSISLKDPGDTLFVDNWRMLHGRSEVAEAQTDRVIERAYFGDIY